MDVAGLASNDVTIKDLEEHDEPVVVQAAHDAQEKAVHVYVRLELSKVTLEVAARKDKVDDLGKTDDPGDEPHDHHADECCSCTVSILRAAQEFAHSAKNVRQIVQVGHDRAKHKEVAKDVGEVETKSCDVVQQHLLEVV